MTHIISMEILGGTAKLKRRKQAKLSLEHEMLSDVANEARRESEEVFSSPPEHASRLFAKLFSSSSFHSLPKIPLKDSASLGFTQNMSSPFFCFLLAPLSTKYRAEVDTINLPK
jgi:hypothetical protein